MDASMDTSMDASMDTTTDITLKRKADDIGGDDATPTTTLLKRIRQFGEDVEKWEDTMDANWVQEEIDAIVAMAMEILAAEDTAKKAKVETKVDTSTCTTTSLDTVISTVPIITATEIQIAPEMSMTLLENGKDTIVKAANDAANNAYEVLLYGPDEMDEGMRVALRDISIDSLKILNIVGVPFMRKSVHYPYVYKLEDAKDVIDAWSKEKATFSKPTTIKPAATTTMPTTPTIATPTITLPDAARKMIVASAIQTIKDTLATFDNSCNLEPDVRQRLHNTVVNQKEILDNVGEPHPEGTKDFV